MMNSNLFSIFDPYSFMFLNMNWISMIFSITIFPNQFWLIPSKMIMSWLILIKFLINEFKIIMKNINNTIIFFCLFMFILMNNLMSLFPYIFSSTSHMSISLSLSLTLWLSLMIFGWFNYYNKMFAHLTPSNTPYLLMPFMVIIESISNIIRPLTLSIRLSANMIAGHLIISLMSNKSNLLSMLTLILTQVMMFILELNVSMIQAYVFSILTLLYSNEIYD